MSVVAQIRHASGVCVMEVSGRLTLGEGASTFRRVFREMLDLGEREILLDLGRLTHLDSAGIGALVSSFATMNNHFGHLKLLNLTSGVKDILLITKLYTVFEVYDNETAALASFSASASKVPATGA